MDCVFAGVYLRDGEFLVNNAGGSFFKILQFFYVCINCLSV